MRNIINSIEDKDVLSFLEYLKYERRLSVNTIDSYGENLLLVSKYLNKDLINATRDDIKNFFDNFDGDVKTKAHYLTVLNSFYKYLLFMGKCSINPCDGIKHPKLSKKLPEYLTGEEINKLFDIRLTKPIDYRNKAMLEVLYATGTRISELINLELNQIDFDECIIRVTGKGKKDRIIPIGDTAMDALKNYILNYRIFLVKTNDNNYVFLNKNGSKISRQGFFKILKGLAFDAGIKKDISPHTIRHSFATNLLNNGADLRIIQELLGHENLQTTEIYSHLTNKKIEDDYQNHPHANN
ncbi:tyrosine recombinase XerD [Clostridium sp. CAG:609]|nr:tyrosine recombinase XerD [Clostridium sp. CAG:609]